MTGTSRDDDELIGESQLLLLGDRDPFETTVRSPVRHDEDGDDHERDQDAIRPTGRLPFVSQILSLEATGSDYTQSGR
jgi:hypothetical protein